MAGLFGDYTRVFGHNSRYSVLEIQFFASRFLIYLQDWTVKSTSFALFETPNIQPWILMVDTHYKNQVIHIVKFGKKMEKNLCIFYSSSAALSAH